MEIGLIVSVGIVAGFVFGLFGAGGSALATPALVLAGVPGALAVATPLPALLPASLAGARRAVRTGDFDRRVATLAVAGGLPGTILGGLASAWVDGGQLVMWSGALLLLVGARVLLPDPAGHGERCAARRERTLLVLTLSFAVGLLTGLLANGGGFLLVPTFVLVLGLGAGVASGTSVAVVGALSLPTLAVHWTLGHVDWRIAAVFALGVLPGSLLGNGVAARVSPASARRLFGVFLVVFASWFLVSRLA